MNMTKSWVNVSLYRVVVIIAILLIIAFPVRASYFGGSIYNVGIAGANDGVQRIGNGSSATLTISSGYTPPSPSPASTIPDLTDLITIVVAISVIIGVAMTLITGNLLLGITSALLGIVGFYLAIILLL